MPPEYSVLPGSDQAKQWENILAKLEKKCKHWTHRALNFAWRLVLTKAVLQAIPQYFLSIMSAPSGIMQKIRNIQRSFLWSGNAEKRKWALAAWSKLCTSKAVGGLSLIDPHTIKKTCGAKLVALVEGNQPTLCQTLEGELHS